MKLILILLLLQTIYFDNNLLFRIMKGKIQLQKNMLIISGKKQQPKHN